jgi:hypothetical protein
MKLAFSGVSRRAILSELAAIPALSVTLPSISALAQMPASGDPLPSWNDGPAKKTIVELGAREIHVQAFTGKSDAGP